MSKSKSNDASQVFRQFAWNIAGVIYGRKTRVSRAGSSRVSPRGKR